MAKWKNDFERGQYFEGKFFEWMKEKYPNKDIKWLNEAFGADFEIDGNKIELKTDFTKWNNFFIEIYSNVETKRFGGPRQAAGYNAKYFLYWFVDEMNVRQWRCYKFKLDKLLTWLDKNEEHFPTRKVKNNGYLTEGRIIPVNILSELPFCRCCKVELSNI